MGLRPLIFAANLLIAPALSAEPTKAPMQTAEQPVKTPAPIVVAAADTVIVPGVKDQPQASPPAKPVRHARVTKCRCGDQIPSD